MAKIIIGLTGEIASGKEVTKKYLIEKYGAESSKFSAILRDVLNRLGLPFSRENLSSLSLALRQTFGEDLLAKVVTADAKKILEEKDLVIIDGVRRFEDIAYLKKLPEFILFAISAEPNLRYERMIQRNEKVGDTEKTFEDFMNDHKLETEVQIPEVMASADYQLDNNHGFESLHRQLDEIMSKLL